MGKNKSMNNRKIESERKNNHLKMATNLSEGNYSKIGTDLFSTNRSSEKKKVYNSNHSHNENAKSININFKNVYASPKKSDNSLIKLLNNKSSQKSMLLSTFRSNIKAKTRNLNNFLKKYSPKKMNTIMNSIHGNEINNNIRLKDGLNTINLKKNINNNNVFNDNNKSRNNKLIDLDMYKSSTLFKSDGSEQSQTNLTTERNKRETKFINLSRRSSLSNIMKTDLNKSKNIYKRRSTIDLPKKLELKKFLQMSSFMKPNKIITPAISNPLMISEEDKIFDEMKKYLFFKYEQKRLKAKLREAEKNNNKIKIKTPKLTKNKTKIKSEDQMKLNYLYSSHTKINKKIRFIQRKKNKQDLDEYQNNLLDVMKPFISDFSYEHLKKKLIDIRKKNNIKYQYNYKQIKEIENEEEEIINDFNKTCEKCLKAFRIARTQKNILHPTNLRIKLPLLNFISCLKKKKKNIKQNKI